MPCEDVDLVSSDCPFKFVFLGFPLRPLLFPLGGEGSNSCSLILSSKSALEVRKHHQIIITIILKNITQIRTKNRQGKKKQPVFSLFCSEITTVTFPHVLQTCKILKSSFTFLCSYVCIMFTSHSYVKKIQSCVMFEKVSTFLTNPALRTNAWPQMCISIFTENMTTRCHFKVENNFSYAFKDARIQYELHLVLCQ